MITMGEFREVSVYAEVDKSRWPEPVVNAWIRDAIRDYSVHFPRFVDTEVGGENIECVGGQQEYELADFVGIQTVLDVEYPFGDDPPDLLERRDQDDPRGFEGLAVYDVRGFGRPHMLRLGEEPSEGDEIRLTYLADHEIPASDADELTVPGYHLDALVLFVQWRAGRAALNRLMTNPDIDELRNMSQAAMVMVPGMRLTVQEAREAYEEKIAEYRRTQLQVGDATIPIGALRDRWELEAWA